MLAKVMADIDISSIARTFVTWTNREEHFIQGSPRYIETMIQGLGSTTVTYVISVPDE